MELKEEVGTRRAKGERREAGAKGGGKRRGARGQGRRSE